ncbi:MAG: hypothetical protein ACPGTU_09755, partial [Myxococcota bacterium]
FEGPVLVSFYAQFPGDDVLVETVEVELNLLSGMSSEGMTVFIPAENALGAEGLRMVVDDDGTGTGLITECSEFDNGDNWGVRLCD